MIMNMHEDMLITLLIEQSIKLIGQVQILIGVLHSQVSPQIQQTPSPPMKGFLTGTHCIEIFYFHVIAYLLNFTNFMIFCF